MRIGRQCKKQKLSWSFQEATFSCAIWIWMRRETGMPQNLLYQCLPRAIMALTTGTPTVRVISESWRRGQLCRRTQQYSPWSPCFSIELSIGVSPTLAKRRLRQTLRRSQFQQRGERQARRDPTNCIMVCTTNTQQVRTHRGARTPFKIRGRTPNTAPMCGDGQVATPAIFPCP